MIILEESVSSIVDIFKISAVENSPVVFPTDTIYGIGALLSSTKANENIYKLKNRDMKKPFLILAGSIEQAETVVNLKSLISKNYTFFKENYKNNVTFLINSYIDNKMYAKNGKSAIRIVNRDILSKALLQLNEPVTATSINKAGMPFINSIEDAYSLFPSVKLYIYSKNIKTITSKMYDISSTDIIKLR